jgi:carboxyvinyl-carboxyphosphonate phosphorylmutase
MSPSTKLRERLRRRGILVAPGAYDCLSARLVERHGFEAVYMSGAGTSVARLGLPDLGLATMTEMVDNASRIVDAVSIPVIADADTGYGGAINARRAIRAYERAGVAAVHLEDQQFPKRCGHLAGKRVVRAEEMVEKIRAAVDARDGLVVIARTDALAVGGWDDALRRCEAYVRAGAEVLFVEAIRSRDQAARLARRFDVPLLYNVVETGRSPLLSAHELERLGFKIALFPASALLAVTRLVGELMSDLRERGTTEGWLPRMASIEECFEVAGLSGWLSAVAGARASNVRSRRGGT